MIYSYNYTVFGYALVWCTFLQLYCVTRNLTLEKKIWKWIWLVVCIIYVAAMMSLGKESIQHHEYINILYYFSFQNPTDLLCLSHILSGRARESLSVLWLIQGSFMMSSLLQGSNQTGGYEKQEAASATTLCSQQAAEATLDEHE